MGHYANLASYIGCSIVFIVIVAYMFIYSSRLKTRRDTRDKLGRAPVSKEEGIAIATEKKEREGRTGSIT
jgi:hypothetical protein